MKKFGLIGFPLSHSFSKNYFEEKFQREQITDCTYDLYELKTIEELPSLLKSNPELVGLNVTIPYKESVIPFLDSISDEAKEIGAVNCIRLNNGKLEGSNTDAFGFETSFQKHFDNTNNKVETVFKASYGGLGAVFILGTGGSSKAVCYVLKKLNLPYIKVSRKKENNCIAYEEISALMHERNIFINTTPLGMFPNENEYPNIPYDKLNANDFLFDLIYNPSETLFLKNGKAMAAKTQNGLEMLELQAEKSWQIWLEE
ncbi:MAG: shikimate dehydrogenase [Bacteroidetes bacterium]|nr:shikimate dehydrogenase [Bacteroidota bacterium]